MLAESRDEWTEGRRYLGLDVLARSGTRAVPDTIGEEVSDNHQALSA